MAYDEALADLIRLECEEHPQTSGRIVEKRMFGGLAFMLNGNMLCGVTGVGGMFRVGREREPDALSIDGVREMDFTGRRMRGFVECEDECLDHSEHRRKLFAMALDYVLTLPAK